MPFKNPNAVAVFRHEASTYVDIHYKSVMYRKVYLKDSNKYEVTATPRYYKSLEKIKQDDKEPKSFLLPIHNVTCKVLDKNNFTGYIVETTISNSPFNGVHLKASFSHDNDDYCFETSDEFLYIIGINLNTLLTEFGRTFRHKPDPNISFMEYFDSYYKSTNFASITKNSDGKVLR